MKLNRLQRFDSLLLISLLVCSCLTVTPSVASLTSKFSDNWPVAQPPSDGYFSQGGTGCTLNNTASTKNKLYKSSTEDGAMKQPWLIYPFFECQSISPEATLVFSLKSEKPYYELKSNNGAPEDAFYCEEALWAARSKQFINFEGLCTFNRRVVEQTKTYFACKDVFFEQYPSLKGKVVVMHFIPTSVSGCNISATELHSLRNLKAVKVEELQNPKLNELRNEWFDFLLQAKNPNHKAFSRQEILTEADLLETKYKSLFVDLNFLTNDTHRVWTGLTCPHP